VLTIYIVLLFALPSRLVIGPLGAAGAPANVVACGCLLWWMLRRLSRSPQPDDGDTSNPPPRRPVRTMMLVFCLLVVLSYSAAMTRSTTETELNSADTALILLAGWLGLVLVAGDAFRSTDQLQKLVRRISIGVGIVALLGIVQFFTGLTLTDVLQIPGLKLNNAVLSLDDRDGFNRVTGTTINPIEFGVVISSMLPLCLHAALTGTGRWAARWLPVLFVAIAIPLSISRSALIAVGLALAILFVTWDKRMRVAAAVGVVAVAGVIFVVIPGMLGALSRMFTGVQDDSSALSRTDSYGLALDFVGRSPWVGRGFLTFLPEYRTLDNQYLGLLIDLGFLGTGALVGLFIAAIGYGVHWRSRITDTTTRSLLVSMIAALSASAVSFAFFDALSFPMFAGLTFLLVGMIDSLGQCLHSPTQKARPRPPAKDPGRSSTGHGSGAGASIS
jgi:O-antigen ligase